MKKWRVMSCAENSELEEVDIKWGIFQGDSLSPLEFLLVLIPRPRQNKQPILIKQPTFFKNPDNPTLIDHILTNPPKSFHSSSFYETGLSDFHKLALTVLKTFHVKH